MRVICTNSSNATMGRFMRMTMTERDLPFSRKTCCVHNLTSYRNEAQLSTA
ncbi:hypothetical protein AHF37_02184 [Paragonimus kellicotti]|nr:hypothetical protein AHF37_02184 [Paragonimus kellicotti]